MCHIMLSALYIHNTHKGSKFTGKPEKPKKLKKPKDMGRSCNPHQEAGIPTQSPASAHIFGCFFIYTLYEKSSKFTGNSEKPTKPKMWAEAGIPTQKLESLPSLQLLPISLGFLGFSGFPMDLLPLHVWCTTTICYYVLLYTTICYYVLLSPTTYYNILLYLAIYYYIGLYGTMCSYMLLYTTIYYYLLLCATIYYYMLLHTTMYYYILLYTAI